MFYIGLFFTRATLQECCRRAIFDCDELRRIERSDRQDSVETREELLTVLSTPAVPLHNNASELGARVSAAPT